MREKKYASDKNHNDKGVKQMKITLLSYWSQYCFISALYHSSEFNNIDVKSEFLVTSKQTVKEDTTICANVLKYTRNLIRNIVGFSVVRLGIPLTNTFEIGHTKLED